MSNGYGDIEDTIRELLVEAERAEERYGPFTSTHEALGVLVEEFDELQRAIHRNKIGSVAEEAKQVAAVAFRLYRQALRALDGDAREFLQRSGCE